ncbi:MAG: hypothetical protein F6J87_24525 [Spirulina sp. SIO3F2]|nr:hypothetical protein [Spirulina sp. SIO3F2]
MKELLLLILLCGIFYAAWSLWREQQGGQEQIHPDLLRAAGGNRALAQRTLKYLHQKYPEKSTQWCREKAIYDLYRDHGSPSNAGRFRRSSSIGRREVKENLWIAGLALWVSHSFLSLINRLRP